MSRNRKTDFKRRQAKFRAKQRAKNAKPCPSCGKRLYRTTAQALDAIATLDAGGRVYECGGGWHTTSRRSRTA